MSDEPRELKTFNIINLVEKYFNGDDLNRILPKDKLSASIFYSIVYGGVQLIYVEKKIIPISRYLPEIKVSMKPCTSDKYDLIKDDDKILDLWITLLSGEENKFLNIISKFCLVYPEGYRLVEGNKEIVPVGLVYVDESEG